MADSKRFWDRMAARYDSDQPDDVAARKARLDRIRPHLQPDDVVLDLGCATGETVLGLAGDVARLVGVDISDAMIGIAARKTAERGIDNVIFRAGDGFEPELEGEGFTVVLAFNIIHLVPDPAATLRRLYDLLPPGGRLIAQTPCLGQGGGLARWLIGLASAIGLAPPVARFRFADIDLMIDGAGFEIEEAAVTPDTVSNRWTVARRR